MPIERENLFPQIKVHEPIPVNLSQPRLCVYFEVLRTKAASLHKATKMPRIVYPPEALLAVDVLALSLRHRKLSPTSMQSFALIMACRGRFTSRAFILLLIFMSSHKRTPFPKQTRACLSVVVALFLSQEGGEGGWKTQ